MKFKYRKSNDDLICITKPAIDGDVGYDIYCSEEITVKAKSAASVKTGLFIELPSGYWMEMMPKSGLATKNWIAVHNGVIDNGYRGEVVVFLYNHSNEDYTFKKNDKVCQGIIRKANILELEQVEQLNDTQRGHSGFGSTGK